MPVVQGIGVGDGSGIGVGVPASVGIAVGEGCGVGAGAEMPLAVVGETGMVSAIVGVVLLAGVFLLEVAGVLSKGVVGDGVILTCLLLFTL